MFMQQTRRGRIAPMRIAIAAVAVGLGSVSIVQAADYDFTGPAATPASYGLNTNWSGNVVPGAGDAAFINGGRIAFTDAALTNSVSSLRVGTATAGELRLPAGSITAGGLLIGEAVGSAGLIDITGGTLTSSGNAVLGEASTGNNRILVSAGTLNLNGESYLGANGNGSITVSGTGVVNTKRVNIANGANSTGAWTINGGTTDAQGEVFVGLRGNGQLTQSAGTFAAFRLQVGQENESISQGTVTVTGGTMNIRDPIVVGENSRLANSLNVSGGTVNTAEVYGGANGIGTVNVSGTGTLNVVGQMHLGASGSGVGTLNVTGGNLNMTGGGGWILVGQNGAGTFTFTGGAIDTKIISVGQDPTSTGLATQSGGTLRSQRTFIVGETSTAGGTYNLSGGSIDVGTAGTGDDLDGLGVFVGSFNGQGAVNISGTGSLSSRTGMTIGYGEGGPSVGTVNVSSGSLSTVTAGDEGRVRIGVYGGATGRLNVSGTGNVNFAGPILNGVARGGVGVGGTGLITVSGGSLTAASMLNETGSSLTQTGGTSSLGVVTGGGSISVGGGTSTVTRLTQSVLTVNGTGSLKISNAATPAASTVGTLATGGTGKLDITNNGLIVDYTGPSPLTSIRQALQAGRIVATLTPADARQAVAYAEGSVVTTTLGGNLLGTPFDGSSIVLRSRLKGDVDLSGTVDFDDLVPLAQNYGVTGTAVWTIGDFDYDGDVDFDDLVPLAQNYSASLAIGDIGSASFQSDWALAQSLVPEPTSLIVLSAGAALIVRRRFA